MAIVIILGIIIVIAIVMKRKAKMIKYSNCILVTGAVKSGKSTFSVATAMKLYRKALLKWKIRAIFGAKEEKPLLYSNVPLKMPYVAITKELIERKKRFRYKSVIYIQEATLLADNQAYKTKSLNERVMLFNKLIGHETRGGYLIYDTQATGDLPAVTRRCLAQNFYIHSTIKWIPFILIAKLKEERYSEDNVTLESKDEEETGYKYKIMSKSVWKKFDCYCFSSFTDNLEVEDRVIKSNSLKAKELVSYNNYETIGVVKDDKESK